MEIIIIKQRSATIIGCSALLFWSVSAVMASNLRNIPSLEVVGITFGVCFLVVGAKLTLKKQWSQIKQPLFLWIGGFLGIYLSDLTFIAAFKYAPPAQADLINFLWPMLLILFSSFLPSEKFSLKYFAAAIIAFYGVYFLISHDLDNSPFSIHYLKGYLLAFITAVLWSGYSLLSRHYNKAPVEMIGMYCGIGSAISLLLFLPSHEFVVPTLNQNLIMLFMGAASTACAFLFWDFGAKNGNIKTLGLLSYFTPILSYIMLIIFGIVAWQWYILIAFALVSCAAIVGSLPYPLFKKSAAVT